MGSSSLIILHRIGHENFELLNHDVVNPLMIEGDVYYVVTMETWVMLCHIVMVVM